MNPTRSAIADDHHVEGRDVVVIGAGGVALAVGEGLRDRARSITVISPRASSADRDGVATIRREISNAADMRLVAKEIGDVDLVVAVDSDERSLLTSHLARRAFDPCEVVAAVGDPEREVAFETVGADCISVPELLAEAIRENYGWTS